jgi:hypothetical protein
MYISSQGRKSWCTIDWFRGFSLFALYRTWGNLRTFFGINPGPFAGNCINILSLHRRRSTMAVMNRNTLVLFGVPVVRDVVTGTTGLGFNTANPETQAMPFSLRQPSQRYPRSHMEPRLRLHHTDRHGVDGTADWAGRPGCRSGVLASRSPDMSSGRIIPTGWSLARRGTCSASAWCFGLFTAKPPATTGKVLSGRLPASRVAALASLGCYQPGAKRARKHIEAHLAWLKPAGGAALASTRGKGSR